MYVTLNVCIIFFVFHRCRSASIESVEGRLTFKQNPAPDGHRCGVCPTYFQKICAYEEDLKSTYIFDNHCIMDLHNCMHRTVFQPVEYDKCVYFGNFAYVHGFKFEDMDYGEDHIEIKHSKKNPDFIRM